MRAPMRAFLITFAIFLTLLFLLSRFESDTVTRTINKFPGIKSQWQARAAAMQSHFSGHTSVSSATSNAAACDADEKTCMAPYTSSDADKEKKPMKDQTPSEYDSADAKDENKRPSVKDEDRDKDRGFTDAEQAAALERLEFKYGAEAKADTDKVMWMESTTTTNAWGADPTEALNSEEEKARKMLGEEYGDLKETSKAGSVEATATPKEKGWRTTGFETKTKTTAKSLISGGGGNGTAATATETATKKGSKTGLAHITARPTKPVKKPAKTPIDEEEEEEEEDDYEEGYADAKSTMRKANRPLWADGDEIVTSTKTAKGKGKGKEAEATPTSKGRWDD